MKNKENIIYEIRDSLRKTSQTKKHSAYQALSKRLAESIGPIDIKLSPKHEPQRLDYIASKISINGKSFLDIGCNTGYFTFELIELGASKVMAYEGGEHHCAFVRRSAQLLDVEDRISISEKYFQPLEMGEKYDVGLLLNIIHHLGDDYGDQDLTMSKAKSEMQDQIQAMRNHCNLLVLQMGFNWHGNIANCLFENGTKSEMISFVEQAAKGFWKIRNIGIAQKDNKSEVRYFDLDNKNIARDDGLGEFLNRPLFVLEAI